MEPYFTVAQVKNRLKISENELVQLMSSGQLEGYDIKHGIKIGVKTDGYEIVEAHEDDQRAVVKIRCHGKPTTFSPFTASIDGKTYDFGLSGDMPVKDWEDSYRTLLIQNDKIVFWVKDVEVFEKKQTRTPTTSEAPLRGKKAIAEFLSISIDKLDQLRKKGLPVHNPPTKERGVHGYPTELNKWMDDHDKTRTVTHDDFKCKLTPSDAKDTKTPLDALFKTSPKRKKEK